MDIPWTGADWTLRSAGSSLQTVLAVLEKVLGAGGLLGVCALVLLFCRALLYQASERRFSIAWVFAVALLSSGSAFLCRSTQSLVWAALGVAALSGLGLALLWSRGPERAAEPPALRLGPAAKAALLAVFGLVVWVTLDTYLWDEYSGHFGLVAVLARGISPVQHPIYPGDPFLYHYGFDALAALVRAFVGVDVAMSIDVASIVCFGSLIWIAKDLGVQHSGTAAGGFLAALLAPLASGPLQAFLLRDFGSLELRSAMIPEIWGRSMPPPMISNFFQHPQGLGMPIALAVLMCTCTVGPRQLWRRSLGAVLLGMLSLAHIVFFGVLGLALGIEALRRAYGQKNSKFLVRDLLCLVGALGIAFALGGFLEPGPATHQVLRFGEGHFRSAGALERVLLHFVFFGFSFLALPVIIFQALRQGRPLDLVILSCALIGFGIPNLVVYERSWDIVKFFSVGCFFANLGLAKLLASALDKPGRARSWAVGAIVSMSIFCGAFWLVRSSILNGRLGVPMWHFPPPNPIAQAIGESMYPLMEPEDRVFSTHPELAIAAGLLLPGYHWKTLGESYLIDRARFAREYQHHYQASIHLRRVDLEPLNVRWAALDDDDLKRLSPEGQKNLADPERFELVLNKRGRGMRIYRVIR